MSLSSIFTELHRNAARTGQDRAMDLRGGARIAVRVQAGVVTLTISRKEKALGATEIETFKRDCAVPSDAERLQRLRQREGATWHTITWRWREDG